MNFAHLHLLLNHFPIIGTVVGWFLFLASLLGKNDELRRASLIVLVTIAILTIPTFLSGVAAASMISREPGISSAVIQRHEGAAMLSLWFIEATGALSLIGLWQSATLRRDHWSILSILVLSLITMGLIARTGDTGADIRHPEVSYTIQGKVVEGPVGSILYTLEPTPAKFSHAMFFSQWSFPILMILHFVGLVLIIGTVGILDIRVLGFLKELPIAPLHQLLPWSMLGLGINILTGMLAFIAQPENYIHSAPFWLKIVFLLLLGLNFAVFYLMGVIDEIANLKPGEDAPISAKLVAGGSLILWFSVITLARYIQPFADSIRHAFQ